MSCSGFAIFISSALIDIDNFFHRLQSDIRSFKEGGVALKCSVTRSTCYYGRPQLKVRR